MNELSWFKKAPESCTALIFGEVRKNGAPVTNNIILGKKAYEYWQTATYLDGLLLIRNDPKYVDWSPLFCALYAGIIASGATQVVELGSTLFATIDKLEKLRRLSNGPAVNGIEYVGVEPADMLRQAAEALHPQHKIRHVEKPDFKNSATRCYQSTSYAFETTEQLVEHCSQSRFGSQGIWFSADGTTKNVSVLGKSLTLFSAPGFIKAMGGKGFTVEFVANFKANRLNTFDYLETWLVYHRFTEDQDTIFRLWLKALTDITGENPTLYPDLQSVPMGVRNDPATVGTGSQFDFTSERSMREWDQWNRSLGVGALVDKVVGKVKRVIGI